MQVSNKVCILDTETTGLIRTRVKLPHWSDANCARLVQLSYIVTDPTFSSQEVVRDMYIKPDKFVIPESVIKIHHITNEKANELGKPVKEVMQQFVDDMQDVKTIYTYNVSFDASMLLLELIGCIERDEIAMPLNNNTLMVQKECKCGFLNKEWRCACNACKKFFKAPIKFQDACIKLGVTQPDYKQSHNALSDTEMLLKLLHDNHEKLWKY